MCVVVLFLVVPLLEVIKAHQEEEAIHDEPSVPQGAVHLVPHLLIKHMDLLKSLNIVFLTRGVGECPDSQVMHMSHLGPRMFESRTVFDDLVLKLGLIQIL